jgi:hypothetical protein
MIMRLIHTFMIFEWVELFFNDLIIFPLKPQ